MMAKYNILREDDDLSKKSDDKKKVEHTEIPRNTEDETAEFSPGPPPESRTPGEEFFTDDIFSAIEADHGGPQADSVTKEENIEPMIEDQLAPELDFPSEEEPDKFEDPEEDRVQANLPPLDAKTESPVYDYDDDYKQKIIPEKSNLLNFSKYQYLYEKIRNWFKK